MEEIAAGRAGIAVKAGELDGCIEYGRLRGRFLLVAGSRAQTVWMHRVASFIPASLPARIFSNGDTERRKTPLDDTPNLALPYILAAQAQKHITHNEALKILDAVVQLSVLDRDLSSPPASPAEGSRYIVAASPTGAWSGHAKHIAAYQDATWTFYVPGEGWMTWISDENLAVVWNGTDWVALPTGGGTAQFSELGVNATSDATNKLAVASEAVLINHVGAGTQVKLNKQAAANTASFLFQTAFSGRAEIGTTGDDSFHFKVSPDGTVWKDAIIIDKSTGAVSMPFTSSGSGTVTNVATGTGLTGGPITTTGTIAMADMPAQSLKGNASAASAAPADLTGTEATALLDVFTAALKGLTPASGGGTTNFLRADGTWAVPSGSGGEANTATNVGTGGVGIFKQKTGVNLEFKKINAASSKIAVTDDTANSEVDIDVVEANLTLGNLGGSIDLGGAKATGTIAPARMPAHTGDVTSAAGSLTLTIAGGAVTNAKLADMPAGTIKGNNTGSAANAADLTAAQVTAMLLDFVGDSGSGGAKGLVLAPAAGDAAAGKFLRADGSWALPPGAGGGEANTASNVGAGGVGVFKQKTGLDLEFKKLNAGSNKITITDDTANSEVDIDVVEANLSVFGSSAKGVVPASGGGTTNFLRADGTWAAPSSGPTVIELGSNFSSSSTTFADITGFTGINLEANSRYLVELIGGYQSAATTTGIAITFQTSGTADVIGQNLINTSSTAVAGTEITGNGTTSAASTGVRATNTTTGIRAWATIKTNGSAQTLAARMRSEVASSQVMLLAVHTILRIEKLA